MKTKIKICGIKDKDIANLCVDLGVDYLGFNFSPVSKRRVDLEIASDILNHLDRHNNRYFKIVALFYKNTIEDIQTTISSLTIDFIQYVVEDKTVDLETIQAYNIPLIPQIAVSQKIEDMHLSRYKSDFVILDSYKKGMGGGTGATFNWELIWSVSRKYFLAGGLNHINVKKAIEFLSPYGVDTASGVESSLGVKDADLIKKFCYEVNS